MLEIATSQSLRDHYATQAIERASQLSIERMVGEYCELFRRQCQKLANGRAGAPVAEESQPALHK
jgi:hypothetical protein